MKIKCSILILLLLVYAVSAFAVSPSIGIGIISTSPGQTVQIPIKLTTNGASILNPQIDLKYDAALLSNPSVVLGASGKGKVLITNPAYKPNVIRVSLYDTNNIPLTDGDLVVVSFTVSSSATNGAVINLTFDTFPILAADADANDITVPGIPGSITISKANQTIGSISFTPSTFNVGGITTVSAIATSGLSVVFSSATPGVCSVSGTTVTAIITGTCTITADQDGNASYNAALQVARNITPAATTAGTNILTQVVSSPSASIAKTGSTLTYTVTYTGADVITLAAGDVTINKTGTANGMAAVSGSGVATRIVTVTGLTGDGTLGISIAAGTARTSGGAITTSASSPSVTFFVDNTFPSLTVSTLANNTTTGNNTLTITGTTIDANASQALTVNGSPVTVTSGAFNTAVTLSPGSNTITVIATDTAGNQSTDTRTIIYDHTAPVITFIAPTPADRSFTNQQAATISGTVSKAGSLQITVNNNSPITIATSGAANSFTTPVALAIGLNTISIKASDTAAPTNDTTVQRTVTCDITAPVLAVTDPDQSITTTYSNYLVKGALSDNLNGFTLNFAVDGISVNPAPAIAANGTFQQSISCGEGKTYHVFVTATDQAGNSTTVQRNIIYRPIGLSDALRALKISMGTETYDLAKGDDELDVGPLVGGKPLPDGIVDLGDAVVLLGKTVGLVSW